MAVETQKTGSQNASVAGKATGNIGSRKAPVRKEYDHVLADKDKFALRAVINARNACNQLAEAIKTGKTVKPEVIRACSDLYTMSGDMIFS
jgi:hypothetical protein